LLIIPSLGVGATPPKEDALKRKDTSSLDRLRKQLLGKNAAKVPLPKKNTLPSKPTGTRPAISKSKPPDSDSEEGGRSSAFVSRTKKKPKLVVQESLENESTGAVEDEEEVVEIPEAKQTTQRAGKRKASSFLDEVLSEKAKKRKGKKKKGDSSGG
jgi:hypothetical protein